MDGGLGARGRAAQPPARYAGCHGARRREHLLAPSTPGCRSPPSPVTAQAGPRAAATTERSASGREARQSFATTARSGGSTALTWRHTWTRALRMCSVTRPSVGRGVNFGCTVKGHGRDAWCEHLDTTHRKIFSRHGDGVSMNRIPRARRPGGRESETAAGAARPR
jgi:hypothetical protein